MAAQAVTSNKFPIALFPEPPWSNEQCDQESPFPAKYSNWGWILDSITQGRIESGSDHGMYRYLNKTIETLFEQAPPQEWAQRTALIGWLGSASAFCLLKEERSNVDKITMGYLEAALMERWTAWAWKSETETPPEDWAHYLVEEICGGVCSTAGNEQEWGDIPEKWIPGDKAAQSNTQMDLFTFLYGFTQQIEQIEQINKQPTPIFHPGDEPRAKYVAKCCVILRVLASQTDKIDPRILPMLNSLENRCDHTGIDTEVLRMAGSADDHKVLSAVTGADSPTPAVVSGARRKL